MVKNKNTSDTLSARISYLEENRRFTQNALEMVLSLGDFQKEIDNQSDLDQFFGEIIDRINGLISFEITAIYLVDQTTSDLVQAYCEPAGKKRHMSDEVDFLIDKGFMSWAIRERRGVTFFSKNHNRQIFLHVIATYSRIRGLFVGVYHKHPNPVPDISFDLFSIIVRNAANALEEINYIKELNQQKQELRKAHGELEQRVEERTAELVNINVKLQNEIDERRRAEKEKDLLLKEVYHRVKNNMQVISSLLSIQAAQVKDRETLELFRESQARISAMALVHEQFYQSDDLSRIDFGNYIRELARSLSYSSGAGNVNVAIDVQDFFLSIDKAIPCGLIINELLSNAFKHAFPEGARGSVSILFHTDADGVAHLVITDNGIGIPQAIDPNTVTTLGLKLVFQLAEHQLGGSVTLIRDNRTEFHIRFNVSG